MPGKTRFSVVVAAVVGLIACDRETPLPVRPSAVTPQVTVPSTLPAAVVSLTHEITLGERVEGTYGDGHSLHPGQHLFSLTPPRSGDLVATLSWDPGLLGTLLQLSVEGRVFRPEGPGWSPVEARVPVEVGRRYVLALDVYGADWVPKDPYVLTTRLE